MHYELFDYQQQPVICCRTAEDALQVVSQQYSDLDRVLDPVRILSDGDLRYVNAYDTNRAYGGPEEGGWWFDCGTLLDCIPCRSDAEAEEARERLLAIHGPSFAGNHPINSVLCEGVLKVCVEDERGADYPATRPHYE